jgi:hypothetical protein
MEWPGSSRAKADFHYPKATRPENVPAIPAEMKTWNLDRSA